MPRFWTALLWIFAAGLALVLVSGYAAPFVSNQNTYFIHGLAAAGLGELRHDWMMAHADTFPLFSHLITAMYWFGRPVGDALAFVFYVLSCGAYALAIVLVCVRLFPALARPQVMLPFLAVLAFFHSGVLAATSGGLSAVPATGVALFYPLGGIFQPQAFGVLLLVGIAAFVWGRPLLAAALIAAGCVMHPAFLAAGGFLVAGMLAARWRQGASFTQILATGSLALLIVLPMVLYILATYPAADPEVTQAAHQGMAEFRSPHHTLLSRWLWHPFLGIRPDVLVKLGLTAAAVYLVRRAPLAWVLGACAGGMVLLTLVYAVTGNHSLGVAYPWRGFALLVPLSTALVTAWALSRASAIPSSGSEAPRSAAPLQLFQARRILPALVAMHRGDWEPGGGAQAVAAARKRAGGVAVAPPHGVVSALLLAGLCVLGGYASVVRHMNRFETTGALHAFVKEHVKPHHEYLIPAADLALMSLRLEGGAPLFVDLKSPPVTAEGFLEWYRRIHLAAPAFGPDGRVECANLRVVLDAEPGITHVVSYDREVPCPDLIPELTPVHGDDNYSVWALQGAGRTAP